jgi:hypothetical protein
VGAAAAEARLSESQFGVATPSAVFPMRSSSQHGPGRTKDTTLEA